jgi:hypothetical protein
MMKRTLLQLHLYFGLSCAVYLIIFGLSSLNMNHHFGWMQPVNSEKHWEAGVTVPEIDDNGQLAQALRDSLGLMGWAPPWRFRMQPDTIRFAVVHLGKEYKISVVKDDGKVDVTEVTKGFWPTLNSLHFLGESIPRGPWLLNSWQYYQDMTVLFIMFSIVSGVYLWAKRPTERKIGLSLLFGVTGLSVLFMSYLWLVG